LKPDVRSCFHTSYWKRARERIGSFGAGVLRLCFLLFCKHKRVALLGGRWRISRKLGPWISRNPTIIQDPHQCGRTIVGLGPAQRTEPPGHKPLIVNIVVLGPFEKEEERIGIASDVVKVQGEDQD